MTLATQGFLSQDVDRFREAVRSDARYGQWFKLADDLIRDGLAILTAHEFLRDDNQQLLLSGLFVRAHQSFQAAVILAEKGIVPDARAIVRSAVETAIACCAMAADHSFVDQIVAADGKHKLTVAKALLADADYTKIYSAAQIAHMQQVVREQEAIDKSSPRAPRAINWKAVADLYCKDLYMTLYRLLSSDGTHTTADVMDRYFEANALGEITAMKLGPDFKDLDETLSAACLTYMWAAIPFGSHFDYKDFRAGIDANLAHYRQLSKPTLID